MISPAVRQLWLLQNVPVPRDDRDLWPFMTGQLRMLSTDPDCYFRVDHIRDGHVEGTQLLQSLGGRTVQGVLVLHVPCCVLQKTDGVPILALTLRRIEGDTAYIQVSAFTSAGDTIQILSKQ